MNAGIVRGIVVNPLRVSSSRSHSALSPTSGHRCARIFRLFCLAFDARLLDCFSFRAGASGAKISATALLGGEATGAVAGDVLRLAVTLILQVEAPGRGSSGRAAV